jgi:Raf kinase inhibitor-like YbhB/YbcL family protein
MALTITSIAFAPDRPIPSLYACEGKDVSPPLAWSDAPAGTKSFALIVDDPDAPDPGAPQMTWVHWVLYDLPATASALPEAIQPGALPPGAREGLNDWGRTGYGGPCPPIGRHRYYHKLYALDTVLSDLKHPKKAALEKAMQGHILAQAVLIHLPKRCSHRGFPASSENDCSRRSRRHILDLTRINTAGLSPRLASATPEPRGDR